MKKLKQNPFFQCIQFSVPVKKAIQKKIIYKIAPFPCNSGYDSDFFFIRLSNVPLYDSDDYIKDIVPSQISGICTAFISRDDFITWKKPRVKIYLEDNNNFNDIYFKYIDFNDIHVIRPDLYVKETLYLMKTDISSLEFVDELIEKLTAKEKNQIEFKKENYFYFKRRIHSNN